MIAHRRFAQFFYKPFPQIRWQMPAETGAIYLTFDDGPHLPLTAPLLDYLVTANIPATFFLSGENVFRCRREMHRLDYSPHTVGNHSFHHVAHLGLSPRLLRREIALSRSLIERYTGKNVRLFRPPYGIFDSHIFPALGAAGQTMVLWSVMAYDFKWQQTRILHHLQTSLRAGDIIVFHDSPMTQNHLLETLPQLVRHCRARGWQFRALPDAP